MRNMRFNRDTGRMEPDGRDAMRTQKKLWELDPKMKRGKVKVKRPFKFDRKGIIVPAKPTNAMKKLSADEINNRHSGELMFIYGNGTSLWLVEQYKKQLKQYAGIGIYVSYWIIPSRYIMFADISRMSTAYHNELIRQDSYVFCSREPRIPYYNHFGQYNETGNHNGMLSGDFGCGLYKAGNSSFCAINLAYIMGAKEIALIGIDLDTVLHFYSYKKQFADRQFYKERHELMMRKYAHWKGKYPGGNRILDRLRPVARFLESKGVKMWNCSPNSLLDCCERTSLGELLDRKR